jgi:hypothetical protein
LTGDGSPDTLMKTEAAGFKVFLRKPDHTSGED